MLALGYAGWQAGQLESEIMANGWLNCPADPDLIFHADLAGKYDRALRGNGIDPAHALGERRAGVSGKPPRLGGVEQAFRFRPMPVGSTIVGVS